jgi:hypothetical protein
VADFWHPQDLLARCFRRKTAGWCIGQAVLDNVIDQVEQAGLDVLIHPRGDQAGGQSQRAFPACRCNAPPARPPWRALARSPRSPPPARPRCPDRDGQVIDVYVSPRRDSGAARRFFDCALATAIVAPVEVVTDQAACYVRVLDEVLPDAWHHTDQYANNRIEADHAQLKRWLRPMCGLKTDVGARTVIAGHAFIQNIRRDHYELAANAPPKLRVAAAFELAQAV